MIALELKAWTAALLLTATCSMATETGYEPQPYKPVKNTPAQLAEKHAALDALRAKWAADGFSPDAFEKMALKQGSKDPSEIIRHFNADGSWHKPLPTGPTFSKADY